MRDFTHSPSVPFLAIQSADALDRMHNRLLSEVGHHNRRAALWESGVEPNVELMLAEAELMAESLSRAAHLLRHVAQREVSA